MCLGVPGRVTEVAENEQGMLMGRVDFGGVGKEVCLAYVPEVELGEAEQAYVLQGQAVFASGPGGARVRMYGPERRFLGVGQMSPEGRRVAPVRIMLDLAAGGDTLKPLEAGDSRG